MDTNRGKATRRRALHELFLLGRDIGPRLRRSFRYIVDEVDTVLYPVRQLNMPLGDTEPLETVALQTTVSLYVQMVKYMQQVAPNIAKEKLKSVAEVSKEDIPKLFVTGETHRISPEDFDKEIAPYLARSVCATAVTIHHHNYRTAEACK
ncbi:unnamed protein product, partial [Amoebophrya sp. A25]|eukprot:GSA25T00002897001.1